MDDVIFTYDEKKNPASTWIDGVPLRDLTKADVNRLPKHLLAAVKREEYYVPVEKETKAGKINFPATKKGKEVTADG